MGDARAIIRRARRQADAELAIIAETANNLARRMGARWVPVPRWVCDFRRMKIRGALIDAGLIKVAEDFE